MHILTVIDTFNDVLYVIPTRHKSDCLSALVSFAETAWQLDFRRPDLPDSSDDLLEYVLTDKSGLMFFLLEDVRLWAPLDSQPYPYADLCSSNDLDQIRALGIEPRGAIWDTEEE